MNHLIKKVTFLIFLFSFFSSHSQYANKEVLYFNYNNSINDCPHKIKTKWEKKTEIQFNLCGSAVLFFEKNSISDTLNIRRLGDYSFNEMKDIDIIVNSWRKTNKQGLIEYYGKTQPPFDKNGMFKTYLVEIINEECFVIYPVKWLNEGVKK